MEKQEFKRITETVNFAKVQVPQPTESRNKSNDRFVDYGLNNLYPNFLLELYSNSATHSTIINRKKDYIVGDGLVDSSGRSINITPNAGETFSELLNKIVLDYLLFNYFCVEVTFNQMNQPLEFIHVPAHFVRTNKSKNKFWFNEDWESGGKPIVFERFKKVNDEITSKLFYFDGYFPSISRVYPKPEYEGALKAILLETKVADFNLNNLSNHFSPSSIITFYMGSNVPEETKRQVVKNIKSTQSGENGEKIIIDFQNSNGKPADVKQLSAGDWDKAFQVTMQSAQDTIMAASQVTSPMLFGVKTEGQLGGSTELKTAYEIYKSTYVVNKRNELLSAFSILFSAVTQNGLKFKDRDLFRTELSDDMKKTVMTINEIRKEAGLPPIQDGDRLLSGSNEPQPVGGFSEVKKNSILTQLTDEDFEKIKDMGVDIHEFDLVEIELNFDEDTEPEIQPVRQPKSTVQILYSYEVREGLGQPIIETTRPFCLKLVKNNRLYTRSEIQSMSEIFGYDIFKHCGGFYTDEAGNTTPHCRHRWKANRVVKRTK